MSILRSLVEFAFTLFVAVNSLEAKKPNSSPPHILFMLTDDLGWLDVGFHGSKINTPTIDSLAKEGVILDNYYVQPLCTPARGALMTGRYPIHTGLQHDVIHPTNPFGLPLDFQTLPERLNKAGYATHLVGKWHLGFYKWPYVPTNRGFDSAFGYLDGAEDHYDHKVSDVVDFRNGTEPVLDLNGKYATFEFVKRIEEILDQHDPKQPLFLYMAFQNVHNPIQAPDQYVNKFSFIDQKMRRVHAGMVAVLDEAVGNITKMFQKKGLWENTFTVFSTDNGGEPVFGGYNWPLRGSKHTLWEGGVRGTAFVHGKMLEKTGVKCEGLLHISDFFPTLINLAGGSFDAKHPIPIDGFDVWNTLSRGEASPRTEILLNINSPPPGTSSSRVNRPGMALRKGSMKLLMNVKNVTWFKPPELRGVPADVLVSGGFLKDETDEEILKRWRRHHKGKAELLQVALYNITADPEERHNLSAELPDLLKEMKERMNYYLKTTVPSAYKPGDKNALKEARKNGVWGPWM